MKKKVLKTIGVMMSAVMILGSTACGTSGSTSGTQSSETTAQDASTQETNGGETSDSQTDTEASGDKVTITLWSQFSDPNSTDGNYVAFYNALESIKTDMPNVEVIHEGTESESYKVKLKTAMAGNELPLGQVRPHPTPELQIHGRRRP